MQTAAEHGSQTAPRGELHEKTNSKPDQARGAQDDPRIIAQRTATLLELLQRLETSGTSPADPIREAAQASGAEKEAPVPSIGDRANAVLGCKTSPGRSPSRRP